MYLSLVSPWTGGLAMPQLLRPPPYPPQGCRADMQLETGGECHEICVKHHKLLTLANCCSWKEVENVIRKFEISKTSYIRDSCELLKTSAEIKRLLTKYAAATFATGRLLCVWALPNIGRTYNICQVLVIWKYLPSIDNMTVFSLGYQTDWKLPGGNFCSNDGHLGHAFDFFDTWCIQK